MERVISEYETVQNEILRNVTPAAATFDSVIRPYAEVDNACKGEILVIYMLQYAGCDHVTQEAISQAQKLLVQAEDSWATNTEFYQLLRSVDDNSEELDPESQFYLEMPSVMLENWCWMVDILEQLSCHYTTLDPQYLSHWKVQHPELPAPPKTIPSDLVENLVKSRSFNQGLYRLWQL